MPSPTTMALSPPPLTGRPAGGLAWPGQVLYHRETKPWPHRTQCKRTTTSRRLLRSSPSPVATAYIYAAELSTPESRELVPPPHGTPTACRLRQQLELSALRVPSDIRMTQGSDQAGAGAGTPPAPRASAGAAGAMALGSILTVAGILLLFVFFALGIIALQCCINTWDRETAQQQGEQAGRRRRRGPRAPGPAGGSSGGGTMRTTTSRGVDPELLRALPVTVYHHHHHGTSDHHQQDAVVVECAVCLAELQDGEEARFLPRCGHGFHAECVDMWLASHTTCPLCRLTVVSKPDDVSLPPPTPSLALPPVAPEPASYATANLPASVLLGVSDHGAVVAAGAGSTAAMVIEIPELGVPTPTLTTPRDAAKSPGSARLRSIRRLWSFGRQGAGATSSCSCAGAGAGASERVDLEKGIS
ncbi:E3 ubiquitin-protein ligase EL5 [Sorghum bicolor]|nr:E3 ubiquitin-protein ligase EL5 [Sorghum bicolor]|eukprot:XP_002454014.2 E3 ubiquitin-protein ligase EL5 [Sorghum bicolor]